MIKKERLEELIKQRAKIWGIGKSNNVFCVGLKFRTNTLRDTEWYKNKLEVYSKFFETKEDAEWCVKYGEVTKTETISFPTYEKIMQDLKGKTGTYTIIDASNVLLEVNLGKYCVDQIYLYTNEDKFNWNLSKEGYEQACERCVHEFKK